MKIENIAYSFRIDQNTENDVQIITIKLLHQSERLKGKLKTKNENNKKKKKENGIEKTDIRSLHLREKLHQYNKKNEENFKLQTNIKNRIKNKVKDIDLISITDKMVFELNIVIESSERIEKEMQCLIK